MSILDSPLAFLLEEESGGSNLGWFDQCHTQPTRRISKKLRFLK
jgi:hypothetical protein